MKEVDEVIKGGYCIGCGACSLGQADSSRVISMTPLGFYQADANVVSDAIIDAVCPFTGAGPNETEIARRLWSEGRKSHRYVGSYLSLYAGHVKEAGFRMRGSSGGLTSWILAELLKRQSVNAVIHVKKSERSDLLYEYGVSADLDSLYAGAKSHYYPVEMSQVLRYIRENVGRYVVVGVPCFIKALRKLMLVEPVFKERVAYCAGLFCGHLKGKGFAEMLAAQCGVQPEHLSEFDFRTKLPDRSSADYGVTATERVDGQEVKRMSPVSDLLGTDWGMGFFKYKACDYCDDISAETADFSVGDAWLPKYRSDYQGTNILIVRNEEIQSIVDEGVKSGALHMEAVGLDDILRSQGANVRHRREDLPYRLKLEDDAGRWRPAKREVAGNIGSRKRRDIQDCRIQFRDGIPVLWNNAVQKGNPHSFFKEVEPLAKHYREIYSRRSLIGRVKAKCKRYLKCIIGS
jgi:coenzyme F420-reducing hydrogenase beta subunit